MNNRIKDVARRLLHKPYEELTEREKSIIQRFVEKSHISRNTNSEFNEQLTFGQRLADQVASFGGSWPFIMIFMVILVCWIALNSIILTHKGEVWDPYPYILLNLFLSMIAALQAPVIMMSQNRHAEKDRIDANHDYEVNLKAELEIMELHQKLDDLREKQWGELLALQQEQITLLSRIMSERPHENKAGD